ncbi:MAG: quinone-dependent dihydroorotate dehydrogenase [Flavobacteriales bacterium]|nr:quinone-dependent dihydroorotate dehydrogenase [Flavobacteriales bacterium]
MYKSIIKPLFFTMQPEKVHHMSFNLLRGTLKVPGMKSFFKRKFVVQDPLLETRVFGIDFPNPVGLAAGFDKDATLFNELEYVGFGFVEIGTVTPVGQPGNPQPRLFRLPEDNALINRMGFNNHGVEAAVERLKNRKTKIIIGGNIGKNKVTPNEDAPSDYLACFDALYPCVDYFVVNVSSPNTPNLRDLQEKGPLTALLNQLMDRNRTTAKPKPLLLKIAPDLTEGQLDDIVDIVAETKIDGVIASNTTIAREPLTTSKAQVAEIGMGGLSGAPVKEKSTSVIKHLHSKSNGSFPIIGVGGIASAEDAIEKLEAGASLVQIYTGYIYEGPSLIGKINKGILDWKKSAAKKV